MAEAPIADEAGWDAVLAAERPRIARLCMHLVGDWTAAEDLAQETLLTAWRQRHAIYNPAGIPQWLTAIARNVCRAHTRSWSRELVRYPAARSTDEGAPEPVDSFDLEVELERGELAELLDRALALLPPTTGRALVQHYLEEWPQSELAARLGISEGAVAGRLHRGKLALRRILTTAFPGEVAAWGLITPADAEWQATRIWCPLCGAQRAWGRFLPDQGVFALRCPGCAAGYPAEAGVYLANLASDQLFRRVRGYKAALSRVMAYGEAYYRPGLPRQIVACHDCGRPTPLRKGVPADLPVSFHGKHGLYTDCAVCGARSDIFLEGLALWCAEGRRFWQAHPRIRLVPGQEVEAAGRAAIVIGFQSVSAAARLDILFARDTYEILSAHGTP